MAALNHKPFLLMGIINVTPDSFYDGGYYQCSDTAVEHGLQLLEEGADILDIGGVSSRPGAVDVDPQEECRRVIPVIKKLSSQCNSPISVDTTWSLTAKAALENGATWINDISAGRFDPEIASVAAQNRCTVVLMHSRKTPATMQIDPHYDNVVEDVRMELLGAVNRFKNEGVKEEKIILDPGIGFAKTFEHNLEILRHLDRLTDLGFPILIGTSRKAFIGKITGRDVAQRLPGTLGTLAGAYKRGATIFRVHDVKETHDFLSVFSTIEEQYV